MLQSQNVRRGFTLLECLCAIAIIGVLTGIMVPRAIDRVDRLHTEAASRRILGAIQMARAAATAQGSVTTLSIAASGIAISAAPDNRIIWSGGGLDAEGVAITGAPGIHRFSPGGLGLGVSNATYELSRGRQRQRVIISRYGRARVER